MQRVVNTFIGREHAPEVWRQDAAFPVTLELVHGITYYLVFDDQGAWNALDEACEIDVVTRSVLITEIEMTLKLVAVGCLARKLFWYWAKKEWINAPWHAQSLQVTLGPLQVTVGRVTINLVEKDEDRHKTNTTDCYRGAHAVILCEDDEVPDWLREVQRYTDPGTPLGVVSVVARDSEPELVTTLSETRWEGAFALGSCVLGSHSELADQMLLNAIQLAARRVARPKRAQLGAGKAVRGGRKPKKKQPTQSSSKAEPIIDEQECRHEGEH
jgi:hypothetical protein